MRMSDWSADVCSSDLWRSGNCRWPGVLLSIVSVASATATAMLPGAVGLHWFYAALMASYLLMGVGEASLLIIAAVTFLVVDGGAFASLPQMWTFVVATALVRARKSVVYGKRLLVRVDLGGGRLITKKQIKDIQES